MQIRRRVLDAWLRDLRAGWGDRAERSASAVTPLLTLDDFVDLHAIGLHCAVEGHTLDDVLAWFRLLAARSRAFRQQLAGGGIIQLASGWAEGLLHEGSVEAVTPFEVLRLRLRQQVQRGHVMGQGPGAHSALIVIEIDGAVACTDRVLQHARETFRSGETMAPTPSGKLLILVPRDPSIRDRVTQVTEALRADRELSGVSVRVWIEPLAMSADHVDSHLLGLAG